MDLGGANLTMDAVAARANMSKGGILHHFGTKTSLIQGMLDRLLATFEADADTIERIAGTSLKAHLRAWINLTQTTDEKLDRVCAALLSAAANDPVLLKPFGQMLSARLAKYRHGPSHDGIIMVIFTAMEGYWLFNALALSPLSGEAKKCFFSALITLVEGLEDIAVLD